jgi:hypothetical protein
MDLTELRARLAEARQQIASAPIKPAQADGADAPKKRHRKDRSSTPAQPVASNDPAAALVPTKTEPSKPPADPTKPTPRKLLLLPRNLAKIAKCAAQECHRYSITGVRLVSTEQGYLCEATDGRMLGRVTGPLPANPDQYPAGPGLTTAPNGCTESVIPRDAWTQAFKTLPRKTLRPITQNLAVVLGSPVTTLGTTDDVKATVTPVNNLEGRWPPSDSILPTKESKATICFNADYLLQLIEVAREFGQKSDDSNPYVVLDVYGKDQAMQVRSVNDAQRFTGLIMPCRLDDKRFEAKGGANGQTRQ